jgi:hypothetical protein
MCQKRRYSKLDNTLWDNFLMDIFELDKKKHAFTFSNCLFDTFEVKIGNRPKQELNNL